MNDFLSTLIERRDAARKRADELLAFAREAQEQAEAWEKAISLELSKQENVAGTAIPDSADLPPLSGVTRKEELVRKALESHGPLKSAQIIKMLQPTVSPAHVYYSLERMKERGEVEKGKDQRYLLIMPITKEPNESRTED